METYGRHRDSIADIEEQLHDIFFEHPTCRTDDDGNPKLPGTYLVEVVQAFQDRAGVELMSDGELDQLKFLVTNNPGIEVTPALLVRFVAEKTKSSPPETPVDEEERGRTDERDTGHNSRSSSRDSTGTRRGAGSRPPSRGAPQTPTNSVFDSSKRQRATPLNNAPSSWATKRPPPHRRKSDAGSRSDSEYSASPSAFNVKSRSRTRAPSNPTSPSSSMMLDPTSPEIGSPPSRSRPPSRQQMFPSNRLDYSSPDEDDATLIHKSISSLPMPRSSDSDEEEDTDSSLGLVLGRSLTSSTVSMDEAARWDALQRTNEDLARKVNEAEKTLQRRLSEHDSEIEDMQSLLEEMRSELTSTKREEKELRSKERQNQSQIGALEAEIAKMTKALENARSNYTSLQKQYQEQCSVAEKYRDDLRARDEAVRTLREGSQLFELEQQKWAREQVVYEERLAQLEEELTKATETQRELDEQKQENLMLKETIDRMRYDMDELRSGMSASGSTHSGQSSAVNTMTKSFATEVGAKMKGTGWVFEEEETQEEEDADEDEEETPEQVTSGGDETEGEDVVQTIITRKKRKVASRAVASPNRSRPVSFATRTFEELKEYSDASTQYDIRQFFVSSFTQTPPEPKIPTRAANTQTEFVVVKTKEEIEREKPVPKVTVEMEIQTEEVEDDTGADTMASSSSTLLPPTPKAKIALLDPTPTPSDQPPAYTTEEEEWRRVGEVLRKYHPGLDLHALQSLLTSSPPVSSIEELLAMPGAIREEAGIPEDLLHEWKALKEELGVECLVIDKILASAAARSASASSSKQAGSPTTKRRSGRFYNIYNTYVYGGSGTKNGPNVVNQAAMFLGVSAFFLLALTPYLAPPAAYSVPGGPSYYDRQAWSAFNSLGPGGEGIWGEAGFGRMDTDPTGFVWSFLGRIGRGAARTVQGWPT